MRLNKYQKKFLQMLESGKYNKTIGSTIRYQNKKYSYCVLGVANLAAGCERTKTPSGNPCFIDSDGELACNTVATNKAKKLLNLSDHSGSIRDASPVVAGKKPIGSMLSLNDSMKISFKEMAKIIRKNKEKFFREEV